MIAQGLKRGESQVRNGMVCLPDFPKAIRLAVAGAAPEVPCERSACVDR